MKRMFNNTSFYIILIVFSYVVFRYANVNFTKNPEKYIKFSPEQVSAHIDRLFDVAA